MGLLRVRDEERTRNKSEMRSEYANVKKIKTRMGKYE
jgi:hypothetical protein